MFSKALTRLFCASAMLTFVLAGGSNEMTGSGGLMFCEDMILPAVSQCSLLASGEATLRSVLESSVIVQTEVKALQTLFSDLQSG